MKLSEFLIKNRKEKNLRLFFDIETLQYNEDAGKEKPSKYKNVTYSVAVSFYDDFDLHYEIFPNFKHFFDTFINSYKKWKTTPKIELIAQNNNKYDNHYIKHDLLYYYPHLKVKNIFLKNAIEEGNVLSIKKSEIKKEDKEGLILEKRIKSSNNLEMEFFINGINFYTTDNFMKTNVSVKVLGEKLKRLDLVTDDELKTDFDYEEFNKPYDMSDDEAREYAQQVFNSLTNKHLTYIRNDVIILAKSVMYYSQLFKGFSYDKITFTSNILEFYNDNNLTSYQLLKRVGEGKERLHVKFTDYKFSNENFYDYLKPFYSGGLNVYNYNFLGKIITEKMFAIDINSSYPYVMHNYKIPTFLSNYDSFQKEKSISIDTTNDNKYTLYRMTKESFDYYILEKIKSRVLKQILVKYYNNKNDYININTFTLKMLENMINLKIKELPVLSYVTFDCEFFGSREKIEENYFTKTQGSNNKKIIMRSPYDIEITNEENDEVYSEEEVDNSKVLLNGLYGIPALRPYFNLFRLQGDTLQNIPNGYKNNERNIVFSIFVTSVSLYNLLNPLKYLTQNEIDENFIYADTDSLYLKSKIKHKLNNELFHKYHLGKWSYDFEEIDKFFVLNHKKYCFYGFNRKSGKKEIIIKSGGIPHDTFNTEMEFEKFVETQFSDGSELIDQTSIYNDQGTISIYKSKTVLSKGSNYPLFTFDEENDLLKKQMFDEAKKQLEGNQGDGLYIESNLGIFSLNDLYPVKNPIKDKKPLIYLEMMEDEIKKMI